MICSIDWFGGLAHNWMTGTAAIPVPGGFANAKPEYMNAGAIALFGVK